MWQLNNIEIIYILNLNNFMDNLTSKIEALLFLSGRPMSAREISDLTKEEVKAVEEAGEKLITGYKEKNGGIQIIKNGASFQMVTAPENASLAQEFVKDETTGELSRPSLETLTIIAYRGPVSKIDLDRIRGINCSLILRNLLQRGLIDCREDKKKDLCYYTVTFDFLRFLGLNEIKELPDYEKLSQDDTIDRILEDNPLKEGEDGVEQVVANINEETEKLVSEIEEVEKGIEEARAEEEEIDEEEFADEDEDDKEEGGGAEEESASAEASLSSETKGDGSADEEENI
jgi:segregation and condensation protein B